MFIENPSIRHMKICDRHGKDGMFHQTLVVETNLPVPPQNDKPGSLYDRLYNDLQTLQELAKGGFVGFDSIEVSGPQWRTTLDGRPAMPQPTPHL